ncbi:hypothetical protein NQ272_27890, partial [Escherichia coli]|nr:hypothetical protein [Escherichia coli]
ETSFCLEISWRGLGEYCDQPWLLHSAERVHLFVGAGGVDCNIPLLGLVAVNGVCMDETFNTYIHTYIHIYIYIK